MAFEQFDTRELFARLLQCEAGGEGENGMTVPSYLQVLLLQRIPAFKHDQAEPRYRELPIRKSMVGDPAPVVIDHRPDTARRLVRRLASALKFTVVAGQKPHDLSLHSLTSFSDCLFCFFCHMQK
jgi:hypothetical protein